MATPFETFVFAELPLRQVLIQGTGDPGAGSGTNAPIGAYFLDTSNSYTRYVKFGLAATDWEIVPRTGSGSSVNLTGLSGNWESTYSTVSANSADWDHSSAGYLTSISIPQSAFWQSTYSVVSANSADWNDSYSYTSTNSGDIDSATSLVIANSAAWNTAGGILTIAQSAEWNSVYNTVSSTSGDWNTSYSTVTANSANWDTAYTSITANSANWNTSYSTVTANSANWNTAYTSITANSSNWDTAYTAITANSANWDTAYTSITANSSNWDTAYTSITANSSNWDTTHSTVTANSASWSSGYTTLTSNSANWDTTHSTVTANSASWSSGYTTLTSNSSNWDTAYTSITSNSSNWDTAYVSVTSNSANWDTAYVSVTSNSANWDTAYSSVTSNSANWDTTHSTVTANSASWGTGYSLLTGNSANWNTAYTTITANTGDWNTAYTTVTSSSAEWDLGHTAYSLVTANSALWGSVQGSGSSGSGSVIAPFCFVNLTTATTGQGQNISWEFDSSTNIYTLEFIANQLDTDYVVVTDAQDDDVKRIVVSNKSLSGFNVEVKSLAGGVSTLNNGGAVMVYTKTPLIGTIPPGFGEGGTTDLTGVSGGWESTYTTVSTNSADWNLGATSWTTITANSASWLGGAGTGVGAAGAFVTNITCGTNSSVNNGITNLTNTSNEVPVDGKTPVVSAVVDTPTVRLWTQWEGSATEWTGCPLISTFPVSANTRTNISNGNTRRFQGYYDLDLTAYRGSTVTIPFDYSGLTKYVDIQVAGLGPEIVDFVVESSPSYGQDHYKDGDDVTFLVVFDTTDVSSVTFGGGDSYAIGTASNVSTSMTATSARFTRTIDTTLTTKSARPFNITAKNALGTEGSSFTSSDTVDVVCGPIIADVSIGAYPGTQTELKNNDSVPVTFEFDTTNVNQITFGGQATGNQSKSFTSMNATSATVTVQITNSNLSNNTGGVATSFFASARKFNHHSVNGPQISSGSDFSKTLQINNQGATFTGFNVTYPNSQQALKSGDAAATVALTISNDGGSSSVSWTDNNRGQVTINSPLVNTATKQVTYAGGGYNISTKNIKCEVTRSENDKTTNFTGVVQIANDTPTISIQTRDENNTLADGSSTGRLRSSGNDGSGGGNASVYNVSIVSNQRLLQAPTLVAPVGTLGTAFSHTSTATTFNNTISIHDNDQKGTFSYSSLVAVNLAGKQVTAASSGTNYVCGGFKSRTLSLPGFGSDVGFNALWSDYTKLTFSWSFPSNPPITTRYAAGTTANQTGGWCILDQTSSANNTGNTPVNSTKPKVKILDSSAAASSSSPSTITLEETI